MPPRRKDNARDQAGKVGNANGSQRRNSTARGRFPERLPAPAAAHYLETSTTGEAQRQRIIQMLRSGEKHTLDFRRAGVMQSQTRIHELRAKGFEIQTIGRLTISDDQGFLHRGVAIYQLVAEPAPEVAT